MWWWQRRQLERRQRRALRRIRGEDGLEGLRKGLGKAWAAGIGSVASDADEGF